MRGLLSVFLLLLTIPLFLFFALPVFLIVLAIILFFIILGLFTGRASFKVYRSQNQTPQSKQSSVSSDKIIDITEDQEKK